MLMRSVRGAMEIEAELQSPTARAQLVHYHFTEPPRSVLRLDDRVRVELCLTTRHRTARACFRDRWNAHRFEHIGNMFLVPPGMDMVAMSDENRSLKAIVCELEFQPILELFENGPPALNEQHLLTSIDIRDAKARNLLVRLADEARHPGFASRVLVEAIGAQLIVELFRYGIATSELQARGGLAPWQLRRIDERLNEMRDAPALVELASLCRISVRQLARGFRASRGYSVGTHVANSQMEHAKRLLVGDHTITDIARILGFSTSSNFCVAFRRAMGLTPGQFRQTLRHSQAPALPIARNR